MSNNTPPVSGRFEFVALASARAKQLIKGAVPRTTGADKPARLAEKEVREGQIERIDAGS